MYCCAHKTPTLKPIQQTVPPPPPQNLNVVAEIEMSLACIVHNGGGVGGSPRYTFE